MNIFEFMSDSPFLTFFLSMTIGEVIIRVFCCLTGKCKKEEK